jgi:hypothetical protein
MYTAKQVIRNAMDAGLIEDYAEAYAEPGYSIGPGKNCILFANWNPKSFDRNAPKNERVMTRLAKVAERAGCEVEWSDEWSTCDECCGAIRLSPDCYTWKPSYEMGDGYIVCHECIDPADYLERLEGDPRRACTLNIDPADHGYVVVKQRMESGFHPGQNADPNVVARDLKEKGVERFLFTIDATGQFDIEFSVWVHESEVELCKPQT